jgi:tetratricopeptide (TPR) repeat protein
MSHFKNAAGIPTEAMEHFTRAESLHRSQRWKEAVAAYQTALQVFPPVAEAWCNMGLGLNHLGRFDEAENAFRRAIEINPRLANAYGNLAVLLARDMGRPDEAEPLFLKALEIDPNHSARRNLEVLRQQRRGAQVARPEDDRLPIEREREADRLEAAGRLPEALRIYEEYLQSHSRSVMALNNAALLHIQARQPQRALPLLEKAIHLDPSYVKAWNNIGTARFMLRDLAGARSAFKTTLQLDPRNAIAASNLHRLR